MSRKGFREEKLCADPERPLADDAGGAGERSHAAAANAAVEACLGNTLHHTRHVETFEELLEKSSVHPDCYESGGVHRQIQDEETPLRTELIRACDLANQFKVTMPITMNGYRCLVHPGGMGKGRQTHLRYRITCGEVTLGLDFRTEATRRLHNFSLTITGKACLLRGVTEIRQWVFEILTELGLELTDEWIRRLDICIDLPELDPLELLTPMRRESVSLDGE